MPKTGHTEEAHECQRAATLGTSFRVRRVATVGGRGVCAAAVAGVTAGAGATRARTGGAAGGALACGPALVLSTLTGTAGAAVADATIARARRGTLLCGASLAGRGTLARRTSAAAARLSERKRPPYHHHD